MSAKDFYHNLVKRALQKDGWRITHDPYRLDWKDSNLYVDLGAEIIGAEKESKYIAVEVKSFLGPSEMTDFQKAIGQFMLYEYLLRRHEPKRELYLALPHSTLLSLFDDSLGQDFLRDKNIKVFGFSLKTEEVTKWLPQQP